MEPCTFCRIVARAVRDGLGADGVDLTQANGAAAGQDVCHFHLHSYPRWHGDDDEHARIALPASWTRTDVPARVGAALRAG